MQTPTSPKKEELTQVVVSSFPRPLLEQIDAQAKANKRSRAAQIVIMLEARVMVRHTRQAA